MKKHADLLIRHADYLDENFELQKGSSIAVADGKIEKIDTLEQLNETYTFDQILDGKGCVYLPGLVDAHMHTGQQLLRGRVLDEMPMIWTRIMLPFESTLTPEKMRLSAQLAALDMIQSGTAGFIDAGSYYMEEAAEVYRESGLRGALSFSTMDQKGLPASIAMDADEAIRRTDALYDAFHGKGNLKVYYSLRSLISCSRELMEAAGSRARERGVNVCHCPFSNCGKAAPDTPSLMSKGIPVSLGTDGAAHGGLSLWNEMKIFRSVMNLHFGVPLSNPAVMPAKAILKMATVNGQKCLGNPNGGVIREGASADLIGIDMQKPHLAIYGHLSNTLLESVNASDVTDSIVGGRVLMEKGQILTLDQEKILAEAKNYHP